MTSKQRGTPDFRSMQHMSRRTLLQRAGALGVGGTAATLFASCGTAPSETGATTLTLWDYFSPPGDGYLALMSEYEKQTGIKIQRTEIPFADLKQKLTQGAASGQLPDIVMIDNPDHTSFASLGVLTDLTDKINEWGKADEYFDGPIQSAIWQEKYYGIPSNSNCLALFYNKDMFDAASVTPPTNWDEFRQVIEKLTRDGVYGYSMALVKSEEGVFQFLPFLWAAGADFDTIDSPEAVSALDFLVDLVKNKYMSSECLTWAQQDAITQFIAQQSAICLNGPWNYPVVRDEAQFEYGILKFPTGKQDASILGGENWAITKSSQKVQQAWDFIKWTQEPEPLRNYIVTDVRLPSSRSLAEDPAFHEDPNLAVFIESLEVARPRAYGPNYPKMSEALQNAIQSAIAGQQSSQEALSQAAQIIKPLLTV